MCWGCRGRFDALSSSRRRVGICARQRSNFLLLRQKKVTKEKASRRQGRYAVPCAARVRWGLAKLASLGQRQPLSERRSAAQPCLTGGEFKPPSIPAARALGLSPAVMRRRVAQSQADQGRRCLSPKGEFLRTPPESSNAAYRRSRATNPARLLFAYFLLAKQEKVSRPSGRDPTCMRTETI